MPRFRQKPSQRREPSPIAKWLVLGSTAARLVVHEQRTIHLTLVKPSHHRKRFIPGRRLAVKSFVGGPTECHVDITDVQRIQLADVDYPLVRALGHIHLDAFRSAWVAEHDPLFEGDPLERFERRHAHKEVWAIRFKLDRMLAPRLLAQHSEELYVDNPARALRDEPPALYEHEWERHIGPNRYPATRIEKPARLPKHLRNAA